jgi:hypothetical protein
MSTAAQTVANIANARFSTGPRTDEGKQRSSKNSLKHGLTAKTVLIPGEDPADYQAFAAAYQLDLDPQNAVECALVQEVIDLQWRLLRISRLEARILSADSPDFKALNTISAHASRLKRQYSTTFKEIFMIKAAGTRATDREMESASTIRRADVLNNRPTDLTPFGFDLTLPQIDAWIQQQDILEMAKRAVANTRPGAGRRLI